MHNRLCQENTSPAQTTCSCTPAAALRPGPSPAAPAPAPDLQLPPHHLPPACILLTVSLEKQDLVSGLLPPGWASRARERPPHPPVPSSQLPARSYSTCPVSTQTSCSQGHPLGRRVLWIIPRQPYCSSFQKKKKETQQNRVSTRISSQWLFFALVLLPRRPHLTQRCSFPQSPVLRSVHGHHPGETLLVTRLVCGFSVSRGLCSPTPV